MCPCSMARDYDLAGHRQHPWGSGADDGIRTRTLLLGGQVLIQSSSIREGRPELRDDLVGADQGRGEKPGPILALSMYATRYETDGHPQSNRAWDTPLVHLRGQSVHAHVRWVRVRLGGLRPGRPARGRVPHAAGAAGAVPGSGCTDRLVTQLLHGRIILRWCGRTRTCDTRGWRIYSPLQ